MAELPKGAGMLPVRPQSADGRQPPKSTVVCQALLKEAAEQGLHLRSIPYPAGALIFAQGDPTDGLYVIREGLVKLIHAMKDGTSFLLRLFGPGDVFGKSALTGTVRGAYAQTLQPTQLLRLKPQELGQLLIGSQDLTLRLVAVFAEEAYESQARLLVATRGSLEEELAVLLWFLQRRFGHKAHQGVHMQLKLSCQLLADMLGHSRQAVNGALDALREKDLVAGRYGQLLIKDLPGLQALAEPFLAVEGSVTALTDFLSQRR